MDGGVDSWDVIRLVTHREKQLPEVAHAELDQEGGEGDAEQEADEGDDEGGLGGPDGGRGGDQGIALTHL